MKFKNNGRVFTPTFIEQLEKGDILLKGYNRFKNGDYNYLFWYIWMRIGAEDLGLMRTSIIDPLMNKAFIAQFPNPTKKYFTINSNEVNFNKVIIYDVVGRNVYENNFNTTNEKSISIGWVNKGL